MSAAVQTACDNDSMF